MKTLTRFCLVISLVGLGGCPWGTEGQGRARFDIPEAECGAVLKGESFTGADAQAAGVHRVEYTLDSDDAVMRFVLFDENDEEVGEIIEIVEPGVRSLAVTTALVRDGQISVQQRSVITPVGVGLVNVETTSSIDGIDYLTLYGLNAQAEVTELRLAVPTSDPPDGEAILRLPQGSHRVLTVVSDGEVNADPAAVLAFEERSGATAGAQNADWQMLSQVRGDLTVLTSADATVESCQNPTATASGLTIGAASATAQALTGCESTTAIIGQYGVALGSALSVLMVGSSVTVATASIAVGTGLGVAVGVTAFVALVAISFYGGNAIEAFVGQNGGSIVGGIGDALANAVGSDVSDESKAAVNEFFGGGGGSVGDPHLTTFDGRAYDLQSTGDFLLVRALGDAPFEVQARQVPWTGGVCGGVAVNDRAVVKSGSTTIEFRAEAENWLLINGEPTDLLADITTLANGTVLTRSGFQRIILTTPAGDNVLIDGVGVDYKLDVSVTLAPGRDTVGLLGNKDGNFDNDLAYRTGSLVNTPPSWDEVHGTLAADWRVGVGESLFAYEGGEGPEDFIVEGFPSEPTKANDIPDEERLAAETVCVANGVDNPVALLDCILDVYCTGDENFANSHLGRRPSTNAITYPIFLSDWTQQGDPVAGDWVVSEDGRSVIQNLNGNPTVFVSPDDYLGVRIGGTIDVAPAGDDDLVGFVFGYHGPFGDDPDTDTAYDTFVLSWKRGTQGEATEGLRLFHVQGDTDQYGPDPLFWNTVNYPPEAVTPLGEDFGEGKGWKITPSRFSLLYTAERIEVWFDGELRLAVDAAASPIPFEPGRFGFFNYSQSSVTYGDFTVSPPTEEPLRADCVFTIDHPEGSNITEDTTWGLGCNQYEVFDYSINISNGATLTIAPGTTVRMQQAIDVRQSSAMFAEGTANEPIVFEGTTPQPGYWRGIAFQDASDANVMSHVIVRHTGWPGFQGNTEAVLVTGEGIRPASLRLENAVFEDISGPAVRIFEGADEVTFENNTFTRIGGIPLTVGTDKLGIVSTSNSFAGDEMGDPVVRVTTSTPFGVFSESITLPALDVAYRFEGGNSRHAVRGADTVVTIAPGAVLSFSDSADWDIEEGALFAVGTEALPIVLTAADPVNNWGGLAFREVHDENLLEFVEVRRAGNSNFQFEDAAIVVTGLGTNPGSLTMRNSIVADSDGVGVLVRTGGTFVEENNSYENNAGEDVVMP